MESTRVDEQRTPRTGTDQDGEVEQPETGHEPFAGTMFAPADEAEIAARRAIRRRALVWGLLAGGVASVLMAVCALLVYLAGTST